MAADRFHPQTAISTSKPFAQSSKSVAVLLLCIALTLLPASTVFGQSTLQQDQQREQQQRAQQQRQQLQREQQQRDQQQREEQQRDQQQRDQQQRDQQQRDQQQRDQQQHSSSNSSAPSSDLSHPAKLPATDVKPTTSDGHPLNVERKTDSSPAENRGATKKQTSTAIDHDLHGKICAGGPCKAPATQPIQVKSSAPERDTKLCKGGHCQPCP